MGTKIVAFVHHKGGTGKTTSCISIAGFLAKQGKRVLAVDLDPQGNLTSGLGIDKRSIKKSLSDVMKKKTAIENVILDTGIENIHLAPSTGKLMKTNMKAYRTKKDAFILHDALKKVKKHYDFILIDTPPSHGHFILNAAVASDKVVMVLDPGIFALEGVKSLQESFEEHSNLLGRKINADVAILTKCKSSLLPFFRKKEVEEIEEELRKMYKDKVFLIPYSNKIYDTHKKGLPISHYAPVSNVGNSYKKLADTLLKITKKGVEKNEN